MRISDWSSDVCSSDLIHSLVQQVAGTTTQLSGLVGAVASQAQRSEQAMADQRSEIDQVATAINEMSAAAHEVAMSAQRAAEAAQQTDQQGVAAKQVVDQSIQIGRASCRARVCQYV